jgi:hypothetical protein
VVTWLVFLTDTKKKGGIGAEVILIHEQRPLLAPTVKEFLVEI